MLYISIGDVKICTWSIPANCKQSPSFKISIITLHY